MSSPAAVLTLSREEMRGRALAFAKRWKGSQREEAHQALDHAVDKAYRPAVFLTERERVEYLFQRYEALAAPLVPTGKGARRGARKPV